jgi:hypothetical protein
MKHRDNNIVALGGQATVNNQQVTVKYASIFHRLTGGSGKEGGGWVTDYVFVEVKLPLNVVVRRAWEPCRDAGTIKYQFKLGWLGGRKKHDCTPQVIGRTNSEQGKLIRQGARTEVLKLAFFLSAYLAEYSLRCSQFENWT